MIQNIFFILFWMFGLLNVIFNYTGKKIGIGITKPFILPCLLVFYIFSAEEISWFLAAALFFSFLGDFLLMFKGVRTFVAGGISFMVAHVLFVVAYIPEINFASVPVYVSILTFLFYSGVAVFFYTQVREGAKGFLKYGVLIYLLVNATMNWFSCLRLIGNPCGATIVSFIGAALFLTSDIFLFYGRFKEKKKQAARTVMPTYIVGEFLIVLGFIL